MVHWWSNLYYIYTLCVSSVFIWLVSRLLNLSSEWGMPGNMILLWSSSLYSPRISCLPKDLYSSCEPLLCWETWFFLATMSPLKDFFNKLTETLSSHNLNALFSSSLYSNIINPPLLIHVSLRLTWKCYFLLKYLDISNNPGSVMY